MPIRRAFLISLAITVALVVDAPAAGASPFPDLTTPVALPGGAAAGACGRPSVQGQGSVGGVNNQVCQGAGLSFTGPSVGLIATVIGPTIIGPAVVGTSIVSAGNGAVGY
jgi:hypothetical protein